MTETIPHSTPRILRSKKKRRRGTYFIRIFILPHTLIGIGAIIYALFVTSMLILSENARGTITGRSTDDDADDGTTYHVDYRYVYHGEEYAGSDQVSSSEYEELVIGTRVDVNVHPLFPQWGAYLNYGRQPWYYPLMVWVFTLFWNAVLSVFVWFVYIHPWQMRRVLIYGSVAEGSIVKKEIIAGDDSDTYVLHYRFRPPLVAASDIGLSGMGYDHEAKMNVEKEDYESAVPGTPVTILFMPDNPKRSLIYQYADYEVSQ